MTREEALGHIFVQIDGTVYPNDVEDLINTLYDDFESRTCDNCKYYSKEKEYLGLCNAIPEDGEILTTDDRIIADALFYPTKDFGCNKFSYKN